MIFSFPPPFSATPHPTVPHLFLRFTQGDLFGDYFLDGEQWIKKKEDLCGPSKLLKILVVNGIVSFLAMPIK